MFVPRLKVALAASGLASAAALAAALGLERWGGLVPCALCLVERWPYRVAAALALLGVVLPRRWARVAGIAVVLALLAGAAAATVHVGVERRWWPSPLPQCEAPRIAGGLSAADRLARMPAVPSKSCEDPTYLAPWLGPSLAELNLLVALAIAGFLATFLARTRGSEA